MDSSNESQFAVLGFLKAHQIKQVTVASALHLNRSTVNRKLNNAAEFTIGEAATMHLVFGVPIELFFVGKLKDLN